MTHIHSLPGGPGHLSRHHVETGKSPDRPDIDHGVHETRSASHTLLAANANNSKQWTWTEFLPFKEAFVGVHLATLPKGIPFACVDELTLTPQATSLLKDKLAIYKNRRENTHMLGTRLLDRNQQEAMSVLARCFDTEYRILIINLLRQHSSAKYHDALRACQQHLGAMFDERMFRSAWIVIQDYVFRDGANIKNPRRWKRYDRKA